MPSRTHIFKRFLLKIALVGVGDQGVVFSALLLPLLESDKLSSSQEIFEAARIPHDVCERKTSWGTDNFVYMSLFGCKELSHKINPPSLAARPTPTELETSGHGRI